jgi:hypothetical protein
VDPKIFEVTWLVDVIGDGVDTWDVCNVSVSLSMRMIEISVRT